MNSYYNSGVFDGLFSGNILDPNLIPPLISTINTLSSPTTYYTYDLDDFPSVPCIGVHAGCQTNLTQLQIKAQESIIKGYNLKPELDKGVAFSGAVLDNQWLIGNSTPVADIHHELDKIVSIDIDRPFTNYGDIINLYNIPFTSEIGVIYGGRAMDDLLNYPDLDINFNLLELTGIDKAGGNIESYHRSTQKFGSDNRDEIESKLMFYVDAFFMKDWGTATPKSAPNSGEGTTSEIVAEPIDQTDFSLYPNPAKDHINILVKVRQDGPLQIQLYDMHGRRVLSKNWPNIEPGHHMITLPNLNLTAGNYILKIRAGDVKKSEKVIMK